MKGKHVFKCAFSRGKAGGVHVKIQKGMLIQFCGFETWANRFLGGGCQKLALFF